MLVAAALPKSIPLPGGGTLLYCQLGFLLLVLTAAFAPRRAEKRKNRRRGKQLFLFILAVLLVMVNQVGFELAEPADWQ